jgi:hypothetical protein
MLKPDKNKQYTPKVNPNQLKGLLSASYERNGKAREIGSKVGYKLDDSLSNSEHKVFTDNDNNPYVVFTGSRKPGDFLISDVALGLGLGRFTPRFQESKKLMDQVKNKYKNKYITTTGHSLGGSLSEYVGGDKVITVNKGVGIGGLFKNIPKNQTDIRTGSDAISILGRTQTGGNQYTIRGSKFLGHTYKHLNKFNKTI